MFKKVLLLSLILSTLLFSKEKNNSYIKYKIENNNIETVYMFLKSELLANGYNIVYEGDFAKLTKKVGKLLNKESKLSFGKKIAFCKGSLSFKLLDENIDNIVFCPFSIAVYKEKKEAHFYISYINYKALKKDEKIIKQINKDIKRIIEKVVF